ncbi:hypothetical protein Kisp01_70800 [Kineosporia sp. NBRC 101677]|uniref:glycoside hydrolase family 26 protein n=1 Tax=Kineosporia sp. NBRC 101677 TaxID=3032197 RepID=UPI0024A4211C|nr:hypothetical protein [Kineosporia sp. NBRC 101677]GLY20066.1 hypothetical protein Kisp01_70800 [Kineosporia sp. NBRC 101677]
MAEQSVHPPTEPTVPMPVNPTERSEKDDTETQADEAEETSRSGRFPVVPLITVIAVVAGILLFAGSFDDSAGEPDSKPAKIGVFKGSVPPEVSTFGEWAGREVDYAADFSARATWEEIAYPNYLLDIWKGSGYRMVYGVAMLPLQDDSATMAAGANGEYDHHFKTLAQNLVDHGQGNSILRLGWEFNLRESRWHPDTRENFISYWQHIVNAMRSVPGAEGLQFDWNPNIGGETYDPRQYFPGGDYVDYIGVDIYDISWAPGAYPLPEGCDEACVQNRRQVAWNDKLNGTFGLNTYANFARSVGKPMSLPEWGVWQRPDGHGGGDNPYFIEQMMKFINDPKNNVAYHIYFDFDVAENGTHKLSVLTRAGEKFRELASR